jgi:hypothetical protein
MKIRYEPSPDQQPNDNAGVKLVGKANEAYRKWDESLALRKEDSLPILIGKVSLRFLGVILMIILSPFLVIGLMIAFAAVF